MNNIFFGGLLPPIGMTDEWNWQSQNQSPWGFQASQAHVLFTPNPLELEDRQVAFAFNSVRGTWDLQRLSSRGKLKSQPLAMGFYLEKAELFCDCEGELLAARVTYRVDGTVFSALIPAEDYRNARFDRHLSAAVRLPGCSRRQFNDLVAWLLHSTPITQICLFPLQGWNYGPDGTPVFAGWTEKSDVPIGLLPRSVLKRRITPLRDSPDVILSKWRRLVSTNPVSLFVGFYRLASSTLPFLEEEGVKPKQYLYIHCSDGVNEAKAVAFTATNDTERYVVPTLEGKAVSEELLDTQDGVAVFVEHAFLDERRQAISGLKDIVRSVRGDGVYNRNLVAVVSAQSSIEARRLAPDNLIEIDFSAVECDAAVEEIRSLCAQMEQLFRFGLQQLITSGSAAFHEVLDRVCVLIPNDYPGSTSALLIMLFCVEAVFEMAFQCRIMDTQVFNDFVRLASPKEDLDIAGAILRDFSAKLSTAFRSGVVKAVQKRKNQPLPINDQTALTSGPRLFLSGTVLEQILSEMVTTHKRSSLISALRERDKLIATDGDTHPIEVHNDSGKLVRLFWYDIAMDLLDTDIIQIVNNLDCEEFWLAADEVPDADFLPLLSNGAGKVAGILMRKSDQENHSTFLSGQSGWGKSFGLAQLAAGCHAAGHRVIWLDANSSATPEALARNLSAAYVTQNVLFYNLDREGVPVNLFEVDRNLSLSRQKRRLLGVLVAAIGELSGPQSDKLQGAISTLLKALPPGEMIQPAALLAALEGEGNTLASLRTKLRPIVEDLIDCGMPDRSWEEFFRHKGRFIVIRMDAAYSERGSALMDMLAASLFDWQQEHSALPMDVFLDELQTQNCSNSSPIRKIVAEGRKYQMALYSASQDFPARSTELGSTIGKAATKIYLKPTQNAESAVAAELRFSKSEVETFDSMRRGYAIVTGNLFSKKVGGNAPAKLKGRIYPWPVEQESGSRCLPDREDEGRETE